MAKKAAKTQPARAGKKTTGRNTGGARRTSTGASVRTTKRGEGAAENGQRPVDANEPELTRLRREEETALADGRIQPHPQNAPRMARTSTQAPPPGRAHVARSRKVIREEEVEGDVIAVEAIDLGVYGDIRRRVGDTFFLKPRMGTVLEVQEDKNGDPIEDRHGYVVTKPVRRVISAEEQFSANWMRKVDDPDVEEHITSSPEALALEQAKLDEAKHGGRVTGRAAGDVL